jgi:2-dehydro-3-deoxygluconokinase
MSKLNVALIGECMVELQEDGDGLRQSFGGDTLNTAVYLSRLCAGQDAKISYVTALGTDFLSDKMIDSWHAENIDTSLVQRLDNKLPGMYMVKVDETGERSFLYWRNEAAAKFWLDEASDKLLEDIASYDAVYLSGISLAILSDESREKLYKLLAASKARGAKVIFDNNYRPRLWKNKQQALDAYAQVLAVTHTALLTFDDEEVLYGDTSIEQCIARSKAFGVAEIVIKQGAGECIIFNADGQIGVPGTVVKKVVDTTAAGDSFAAGYLAARLLGGSAEKAAKTGHVMAGTVIQHKGALIATEVMPKFDSIA